MKFVSRCKLVALFLHVALVAIAATPAGATYYEAPPYRTWHNDGWTYTNTQSVAEAIQVADAQWVELTSTDTAAQYRNPACGYTRSIEYGLKSWTWNGSDYAAIIKFSSPQVSRDQCWGFTYYVGAAVAWHSPGESLGIPDCDDRVICGNPINIAARNKLQVEIDIKQSPFHFARYYNSRKDARSEFMGAQWTHTFDRRVEFHPDSRGEHTYAIVFRQDGRSSTFRETSEGWINDVYPGDSLVSETDSLGAIVGWRYSAQRQLENELYDGFGRLVKIDNPSAATSISITYQSDSVPQGLASRRILTAQNEIGRSLSFQYNGAGRLQSVTDPNGSIISYEYDSNGNLSEVRHPGSSRARTYQYSEQGLDVGAPSPHHLTGITDESGVRFATYKYDAGRPISTEHNGAEKFEVNYDGAYVASVTTPLGLVRVLEFQVVNGVWKSVSIDEVCDNCPGRSSTRTFDSSGRMDVDINFSGTATDHDYNSRGLESKVTFAFGDTSGVSRETQTDWHATLPVPLAQRLYDSANALVSKTNWTYNARGQVLTQTRTDPATNAKRITTYTYCNQTGTGCPLVGLLTSINGPRTDVTDTTTLAYYASDAATCASAPTSCAYRKGDLWKITDAQGGVVTMLAYDGAGRLKSSKDSSGVITDREYHARGWLTAIKVRGTSSAVETDDAITRMTYDDVGQVATMTAPNGAKVTFSYDAAHRLTAMTDALGNAVTYRLDAAGNRLEETTRDAGGALRHTLARLFNGMGQLTTAADAQANATDAAYDAMGHLDTVTDPLGRVTDNSHDALGRLRQTIANAGGTGANRAQTSFEYDALDNLVEVVDPKGLITGYGYNGLGDLVLLDSPDTGATVYTYDAAGNRTRAVDARGVTTNYVYDSLSRPVLIDRPTAGQDSAFAYDTVATACLSDEAFGIGRLGTITDPSGSTQLCYDRRGNLVRKVQAATGAAASRTVRYSHNLADQLVTMTYPSGATVTYTRDATGRIAGVSGKPTATAAPVTFVSGVAYLPFGPAKELTFGNGRRLSKAYDLNYGIDAVTDSVPNGLSLDLGLDDVGNVTALNERLATGATAARTVAYDGQDRLTALKNGATNVQSFTYDATGNRTKKGSAVYTYAANSHRLTKTGTTARSFDATGNTTAIGTKTYTYDDAGRMSQYLLNGVLNRTFAINALGQRVAKKVPGKPTSDTYFVYDEAGHLIGEYRGNGARIREIVWLDDTPVAVLASHAGSTYQYVLTDHLNTPRAVVHPGTNAIVWRWDLTGSAFGEHAAQANPDGDANSYAFNLRYPGQYLDTETGLHYNYFRDYEPGTGRYVQSDPIGLAGGLSTYAYVESGPLGAVDPEGLASCTYVISIGTVVCQSQNLVRLPIEISVAAGNNGNGMSCKNNPFCTHLPNRGPIPQGDWAWNSGWTGKPNGRVLVPQPGTETYGRDLFRTHSCLNAFGQSSAAPYCSEGCITGSASDMKMLNQLLDAEPNSTLRVESFRDVPMPWAAPARPSPWAVRNYGGGP